MSAWNAFMAKHNGGLGEIFLDELNRFSFDWRGLFHISCCRGPLLPGAKMALYQCGGLLKRDVADDGQDDLGRGIFLPVEGLYVG